MADTRDGIVSLGPYNSFSVVGATMTILYTMGHDSRRKDGSFVSCVYIMIFTNTILFTLLGLRTFALLVNVGNSSRVRGSLLVREPTHRRRMNNRCPTP